MQLGGWYLLKEELKLSNRLSVVHKTLSSILLAVLEENDSPGAFSKALKKMFKLHNLPKACQKGFVPPISSSILMQNVDISQDALKNDIDQYQLGRE